MVWGKPESQGPALGRLFHPWLGDTASGQTLLPPPWRGNKGSWPYWGCPGRVGGWCRGKGGGPLPMCGIDLSTPGRTLPQRSAWWPQKSTSQTSLEGNPTGPPLLTAAPSKTCSRGFPSLPLPDCPCVAGTSRSTRPRPHLLQVPSLGQSLLQASSSSQDIPWVALSLGLSFLIHKMGKIKPTLDV